MEGKKIRMWIYPLKGGRGVEVEEAYATNRGFEGDRRWMLVDEQGCFLSQREFPQLAQCIVEKRREDFWVSFNGDSCSLPTREEGEKIEVRVWEDSFEALLVGIEESRFFSEILQKPVQLVYMNQEIQRRRRLRIPPGTMEVSFADGYPYLVLGTSSLAELEKRVGEPMVVERFRPNLLVETHVPHEEDTWKNLVISGVTFSMVKPCARCVVVGLDPKTGQKGKEPLATLSQYRKVEGGVMFGMNAIVLKEGWVRR